MPISLAELDNQAPSSAGSAVELPRNIDALLFVPLEIHIVFAIDILHNVIRITAVDIEDLLTLPEL